MKHFSALIVGGGHAGSQTAIALRQARFPESVAILSDELTLPYERPPLSKDYLQGRQSLDQIMIRNAEFWPKQNVEVLLEQRVKSVEPAEHRVVTLGGAEFTYDTLIWAAGGALRRLACSGAELEGIHYVRRLEGVERLRSELARARRVAIVGGGFIGLEVAASLRRLEKEVTVVEASNRVMARFSGPALSRFVEAEHRRRGVKFRTGVGVNRIQGQEGRVVGLELTDNTFIEADLVVAGIGIVPEVQQLLSRGAKGGDGVRIDSHCRTSLPDIYAVGDCALHSNRFAGGKEIRLESVQNAIDQGTVAAKVIAGGDAVYDQVPWFWSTQYDLKLQTAGLCDGFDEVRVSPERAENSFVATYLRQGRLLAVDCINAPREFLEAKRAIRDGVSDPKAER